MAQAKNIVAEADRMKDIVDQDKGTLFLDEIGELPPRITAQITSRYSRRGI
ncbi:hypothetical protein LYNGBM3L_15050 [Moorena producens 3L]|uniref:Uncharacterized protein n=1 Tax=Moorena producens 3L TaxID=489825 RepID=F4XS80_9CYAN|nr:hypothetical protein [Moorena producens]EGJ32551.1 hypothetical protein LYNGBM3L_15050 [Moorena producens 3L]